MKGGCRICSAFLWGQSRSSMLPPLLRTELAVTRVQEPSQAAYSEICPHHLQWARRPSLLLSHLPCPPLRAPYKGFRRVSSWEAASLALHPPCPPGVAPVHWKVLSTDVKWGTMTRRPTCRPVSQPLPLSSDLVSATCYFDDFDRWWLGQVSFCVLIPKLGLLKFPGRIIIQVISTVAIPTGDLASHRPLVKGVSLIPVLFIQASSNSSKISSLDEVCNTCHLILTYSQEIFFFQCVFLRERALFYSV